MAERMAAQLSDSTQMTKNGETIAVSEEEAQARREAMFYRLDMLGYRVGQGLVERYVFEKSGWQQFGMAPCSLSKRNQLAAGVCETLGVKIAVLRSIH